MAYCGRMKPRPLRIPLPNPRSVRYCTLGDDDEFHELQIALAILAEDESGKVGQPSAGRAAVDQIIRDACFSAAFSDSVRAIRELITGPDQIEMACEILAALGRFLDDCENGRGPT